MGNHQQTPSTSTCSPVSSPSLGPNQDQQNIKDIKNCIPQVFVTEPIFKKEESLIIASTAEFSGQDPLPLAQFKNLNVLLREVPVGPKDLFKFQRIIEHSSILLSLSVELHECQIGDGEVNLLLFNANKMHQIQYLNLNLQYNRISTAGFLSCVSYVSQVKSILYLSLDLRGNTLYGKLDKYYLSKYLGKMEQLISLNLNLSLCQMPGEDIASCSESIKQLQHLTDLTFDISENALKDDYILEVLSMNISKITSLTRLSLDISVNPFSDECVAVLFQEIAQLTQLTSLQLDLTDTKELSTSLSDIAPKTLSALKKLSELRIETSSSWLLLQELYKVAEFNHVHVLPTEYCGDPPELEEL